MGRARRQDGNLEQAIARAEAHVRQLYGEGRSHSRRASLLRQRPSWRKRQTRRRPACMRANRRSVTAWSGWCSSAGLSDQA